MCKKSIDFQKITQIEQNAQKVIAHFGYFFTLQILKTGI